jgi:hypothetical protein
MLKLFPALTFQENLPVTTELSYSSYIHPFFIQQTLTDAYYMPHNVLAAGDVTEN